MARSNRPGNVPPAEITAALRYKTTQKAPEASASHRHGDQRHERVHDVVVMLFDPTLAGELRPQRRGDMGVLAGSDGFKDPLLAFDGKAGGGHGTGGEEQGEAEF
jgi:hypothetical protein